MQQLDLPPRQQLAAAGKWPTVGERTAGKGDGTWRVHVDGKVARPYALMLSELQALPQVEQTIDIHCVTRWSKLAVHFSGVPLASLVETAAPDESARFVSFAARSGRGHSTSLVLADALALKTLVALAIDGRPLDESRGGPVRVIVPGRYFYKSLKWLERVELLSQDRLGFWEGTAGYHNTGDIWREERYMAGGISKAEAQAILADRDISGRELRSLDAQGRDLTGLAATGSLLRDADFRNCSLRAARFEGANLSNARFDGADLRDANFRGADLEGADFSGADLRAASFVGASLFGTSFHNAGNASGAASSALVDDRTQIDDAGLAALTPQEHAFLQAALALARK
jgi:DMSO/TMAO reductase YedYZ molybdopterin-dependent catalytic subunit